MKMYTDVQCIGNYIYYRGYENGKRIHEKIEFMPSLYLPSNKPTIYRTIQGKPVELFRPGSINDAREFVKNYSEISNFEIFGNTKFEYQYISSLYPHKEEANYDMSTLKILTLDIETESENGYPTIPDANERINVITIDVKDKKYVFALGDANINRDNTVVYCYNEEKYLLEDFVNTFVAIDPDVITGWNVRFFDIPYIICRICKVLGEDAAKKLSPWKRINSEEINFRGKDNLVYTLCGISILDYYEMYRKYTFTQQENYKLGHIGDVELNLPKIDHSEYETFKDFYTNNFQKFVEYNIHDVEIVKQLDKKLNLIELHISQAYMAKVNYVDVFSQVRTWDMIIYNHLDKKNIVIPQKKSNIKNEQYDGAYVKEPKVGMHEWIVSFDLASLYPSLIRQYNISSDTIIENEKIDVPLEKLINKTENTNIAKKLGYSMAANGQMFSKDKQGFLSELMEKMYEERKNAKNKMIIEQKKLEIIKNEMKKRGIS